MKRLLFSLFFLVSILTDIDGQSNLPAIYEIKSDTTKGRIIFPDSCWQILPDTNSKWTIEQVNSVSIAGEFLEPSPRTTAVDYSIHTYWMRYRIKNSMDKDISICIPGGIDLDEIYYKDVNGKWQHQQTGPAQPWSKRDGLKRTRQMPVLFRPNEEKMIYERLTSDYSFNKVDFYNPDFDFTEAVLNENYTGDEPFSNTVLFSFLFGILFLAALINFLFFLIIREWIFFYFCLFVVGIGLLRFANNGYLEATLLREWPWGSSFIVKIMVSLTFYSLIQFTRKYLGTKLHFSFWDKVLLFFCFYTPTLALTGVFTVPSLNHHWALIWFGLEDWSYSLTTVIVLIAFLLYVRRSESSTRLVMIAGLPILLFWGFIFFGDNILKLFGIREPLLFRWFLERDVQIEQICVAWFAVFFSWILLLRFVHLRKEIVQKSLEKERLAKEKEIERNLLIAQQKVELEKQVAERTAELKQSFEDLKSTQTQLIQSEKMASLGELTAGIAHEIQNPLNFVNNFSEVNNELIEELKIKNSNPDSNRGKIQNGDGVEELLNDIYQNNEKIAFHGKRADAIVKGMLQHSRTSSGQKEFTDINALADEYLRLAYHGLRAKDKAFNSEVHIDFDETIGKINIVPQEIGRVILNLINNAFYAASERKKADGERYEPIVSVSTKKIGNKISINVKDNGNGIRENIIGKIFQPFFTTKPTGQGTGLGLSLSYDIVKAHGGEIKVRTKENEGTEFTIMLPA